MCILYNQRDAVYTMLFIIISAVHVSVGFSAHHQELIKFDVEFHPNHTSGRQQKSMKIPKAAHTVL
jgi:hypothetical protein